MGREGMEGRQDEMFSLRAIISFLFLILCVGGLIDAHPVYYNLRWLIYYLISLLWDENFILHLYIFVPDLNCLVLCPAVHTPRQRSAGGLIWISCYKGVSGKCIIIVPRMQFNKTTTHPPLGGVDGQVWGDELHGLAVRVETAKFYVWFGPLPLLLAVWYHQNKFWIN